MKALKLRTQRRDFTSIELLVVTTLLSGTIFAPARKLEAPTVSQPLALLIQLSLSAKTKTAHHSPFYVNSTFFV